MVVIFSGFDFLLLRGQIIISDHKNNDKSDNGVSCFLPCPGTIQRYTV